MSFNRGTGKQAVAHLRHGVLRSHKKQPAHGWTARGFCWVKKASPQRSQLSNYISLNIPEMATLQRWRAASWLPGISGGRGIGVRRPRSLWWREVCVVDESTHVRQWQDPHPQTSTCRRVISLNWMSSVEWAKVIFLVSVLTVVAQDAGLGDAGWRVRGPPHPHTIFLQLPVNL